MRQSEMNQPQPGFDGRKDMNRLSTRSITFLAVIGLSAACSAAVAQMYSAEAPEAILTPDVLETQRLGTLRFFDGMPDEDTVRKTYDNLDFMRGVEAFLSGMPAASLYAMCSGLEDAGLPAHSVGITEDLLDARALWLTANSTTVYVTTCLDLKQGPVVVEVPPGVLGFVNDAFFRWVADVGVTGMDQGRGGRYLFLPPGYDGPVPERGFHVVPTDTNMHWVLARAFVTDGGLEEAVAGVKAGMKVYLLSEAASPPEETFVDLSGRQMSTIHANDVTFYEELAAVVQNDHRRIDARVPRQTVTRQPEEKPHATQYQAIYFGSRPTVFGGLGGLRWCRREVGVIQRRSRASGRGAGDQAGAPAGLPVGRGTAGQSGVPPAGTANDLGAAVTRHGLERGDGQAAWQPPLGGRD